MHIFHELSAARNPLPYGEDFCCQEAALLEISFQQWSRRGGLAASPRSRTLNLPHTQPRDRLFLGLLLLLILQHEILPDPDSALA